jgi:hypothetical protein
MYLTFNLNSSGKHAWKCPLCQSRTTTSDLKVDDFVASMITTVGKDVVEVEVYSDATFTAVVDKQNKKSRSGGSGGKRKSVSSSFSSSSSSSGSATVSSASDVSTNVSSNADAICLSSDEEMDENEAAELAARKKKQAEVAQLVSALHPAPGPFDQDSHALSSILMGQFLGSDFPSFSSSEDDSDFPADHDEEEEEESSDDAEEVGFAGFVAQPSVVFTGQGSADDPISL